MTTFTCGTCFDTLTVDRDGGEVDCPDCCSGPKVRYHPSSVFITPDGEGNYVVHDNSIEAGYIYAHTPDLAHATYARNKRRGVIKAAITRRANKARRLAQEAS